MKKSTKIQLKTDWTTLTMWAAGIVLCVIAAIAVHPMYYIGAFGLLIILLGAWVLVNDIV